MVKRGANPRTHSGRAGEVYYIGIGWKVEGE
jgi:hypothetical protein